ncbi:MAG: VOC family protein [Gammaproteobacteria bacterium]|nr:VOC family protein [Gammaproteobacteria bacterium]MDH3387783.1 VOC family protein [Gammaproteobacteria bacterium]
MKRLHVSVSVTDLDASIGFYRNLFAAEPSVVKADYAKWMLDDPCVNFAVTTHGAQKGVDHFGIQAEDEAELSEVYGRLKTAGDAVVIEQGETVCCYAQSEKSWIFDPEGIAWETFLTRGQSPVYGTDEILPAGQSSACCDRPKVEQARVKSGSNCC